jgi:alpha-galactosidase
MDGGAVSTRIVIIGAGGVEFPVGLMNDFLSFPALGDAEYVLMDIDPVPLERTARLSRQIASAHGLPARILSTTSLREALAGAQFVVTCFQVGGRTAYRHDIEIPARYGVDQTVGDTMGPGGVMRGLRSMRALDEICAAMRDLCPDALLLNYTNPMSINCAFTSGEGVDTIGLCHSIQHTAQEIADIAGYADGTWSFRAGGINHQAWILEYRHDGRDVLPEVRRTLAAYGRGEIEPAVPIDEWYAGGREAVRLAIMELTGYFQTESSHHASEYYPYFRRTAEDAERVLPQPWRYLEVSSATTEEDLERLAAESSSGELETTEEYAARIIDSIVTNTSRTVYGNVPNRGLITNLPPGSCVEVPVLVDGSGVQPTVLGDLPVACAAVNQASVGLQALTVEAYRTRSRDLVYAAIAMDRLTGSLLSLDRIRAMADELIDAEQGWLPELR